MSGCVCVGVGGGWSGGLIVSARKVQIQSETIRRCGREKNNRKES